MTGKDTKAKRTSVGGKTASGNGKSVKKKLPIIPEGWLDSPGLDGDGHLVDFGGAWVVAFTGTRGGGKSLTMAGIIAKALISGVKVWSNMAVEFKYKLNDGHYRTYKTLPLDWDAVYALSQDLHGGLVAIDEFQYYLDSRQSLTIRNRLINAVMYQVRKRSLDVFLTVKDIYWLDKRMRAQELDIEVKCWDNHMSDQAIPKGTAFHLAFYDRSGAWTGHPYIEGMPYKPCVEWNTTENNKLWGIYDTLDIIDYDEVSGPVQNASQQKALAEKTEKEAADIKSLFKMALTLKQAGHKAMNTDAWNIMAKKEYGVSVNPYKMGRLLIQMGVVRVRSRKSGTSSVYDLDELFIPDEMADSLEKHGGNLTDEAV